MPIGPPSHRPEPKSACTVRVDPALAIHDAEEGCALSPVTRARQKLLAGVMVHPVTPGMGTNSHDVTSNAATPTMAHAISRRVR